MSPRRIAVRLVADAVVASSVKSAGLAGRSDARRARGPRRHDRRSADQVARLASARASKYRRRRRRRLEPAELAAGGAVKSSLTSVATGRSPRRPRSVVAAWASSTRGLALLLGGLGAVLPVLAHRPAQDEDRASCAPAGSPAGRSRRRPRRRSPSRRSPRRARQHSPSTRELSAVSEGVGRGQRLDLLLEELVARPAGSWALSSVIWPRPRR